MCTGLKTIVRGEEWHKDCYERANPAKGPSRGMGAQVSRCPGCHQEMVVGQDTGKVQHTKLNMATNHAS